MNWVLFALASPFLYAFSGVIDNYLSDKLFRKTTSLIFYSFVLQLIGLPVAFLIQTPSLPPLALLPFFLVAGLCEIFYLYPYYKALQNADTAVVNSLWAINRVFVPIGAFFFIGEALGPAQYFGFFLVVISSMLLSHSGRMEIRFNKSLLYMIIACTFISVEVIIYKHLLNNVGWSTTYGGVITLGFLFMLPMLIVPKWRKGIVTQWSTFRSHFHWFAIEESSTAAANMAWSYAASLAPVSLVMGIGAIQPFAVLAYAFLFSRIFPGFFKEKIDSRSMVKKVGLFAVTAIGVYLIAG